MLDELKQIESELSQLRDRVRRLINLMEKRHVRLAQLEDSDALSEVASRTLPATEVAKLLDEANKRKKSNR